MNGLRIMEADIINFKNIVKKELHVEGKSFIIFGGNGKGKSSLIQGLLSPLDSQYVPQKPIKDGEEKASIKLKIAGELFGEQKEYQLDLYFTESNQQGRLVVTNHLGETVKSPKTIMKSLLGNIGFDIFDFLKSSPIKQVETLKKLAGIDFFELDKKRKEIYDKRTYTNTRVKEEEALLKNHGYTDDQIDKYSKQIDTTELKATMANLSKSMEDYVKVEAGIVSRRKDIEVANRNIESTESSIRDMEVQIIKMRENIESSRTSISKSEEEIGKGELWLSRTTKPSVAEIQSSLDIAESHNDHYVRVGEYFRKVNAIAKMKAESEEHTESIKAVDIQKQQMIQQSAMPIEGLTFDESQPYFNGLPLASDQISKSKLIEIGMRMGMSMNPNLRVIIINDGSLADKEQLGIMLKLAEENNYQIIVEKVDENGGEMEIKFTEAIIE